MSAFDLIIFDCDGVLIESEVIAYHVESALFRQMGADISPEEVGRLYSGTSPEFMYQDVKKRFGIIIDAEDFSVAFKKAFWPRAEKEMGAVAGVIDFIETLTHDRCVCSNSSFSHVRRGLEIAGIRNIDRDHLFAATDHGKGKPAPDVFLHAAAVFDVDPKQCLVIEDSPSGVQGGCAAGMTVAGFTGGSHCTDGHSERLRNAGAHITTSSWSEIRNLLNT